MGCVRCVGVCVGVCDGFVASYLCEVIGCVGARMGGGEYVYILRVSERTRIEISGHV